MGSGWLVNQKANQTVQWSGIEMNIATEHGSRLLGIKLSLHQSHGGKWVSGGLERNRNQEGSEIRGVGGWELNAISSCTIVGNQNTDNRKAWDLVVGNQIQIPPVSWRELGG